MRSLYPSAASYSIQLWLAAVACLLMLLLPSLTQAQTGPGGVGKQQGNSSLNLWLRGDKATVTGNKVTTWNDRSGYEHHFTQTTLLLQPALLTSVPSLNQQPALEFDGNDQHVIDIDGENYVNGKTAFTIFTIIQADAIPTNRGIFDTEDMDGKDDLFGLRYDAIGAEGGGTSALKGNVGVLAPGHFETSSNTQTTNPQMISYYWDSGNKPVVNFDGKADVFSTGSVVNGAIANSDYFKIGRGAKDNGWKGKIAEFIYFDERLSQARIVIVENYLSALYDITLANNDYYAGDTPANGNFDYEVAGIGQENGSNHRNANTDALNLLTENADISDGDYLLAGHNNTPHGTATTELPSGVQERWARTWYVDKTGALDATLRFDLYEAHPGRIFSTTKSNYVLLRKNGSTYEVVPVAEADKNINDESQISFRVSDAQLVDGEYTIGTLDATATPLAGFQLDTKEYCEYRENFNNKKLSGFLEEGPSNEDPSGIAIDYSTYEAKWDPSAIDYNRRYIRTTDKSFFQKDLAFEVTVKIPASNNASGTLFVGLGPGDAKASGYFGEPDFPLLGMNITVDQNGNKGRLYFFDKKPGDSKTTGNKSDFPSDVSGKTIRFRITWNATLKLALCELDYEYDGKFEADHHRILDGNDNGFDATNMAVYFGGGKGLIFDDFILRENCDPDGDLLGNSLDIDSDNDGILDTEECLPTEQTINAGDAIAATLLDRDLSNFELASIQSQGANGDVFFKANKSFSPTSCATSGNVDPTAGFEYIARAYEIVDLPACVQSLSVDIAWTIEKKSGVNNSGRDAAIIVINQENGEILKPMDNTILDTPKNIQETNNYTLNFDTSGDLTRILIIPVLQSQDGQASYTWLSDIAFTFTATTTSGEACTVYTCNPDRDGDGIPNRLDLDSDNDGIPDNIEAQTTLGYAAPSSDNNGNGLADNYESGATLGLIPVDTDNDGTPDYFDLDSDNDDILDHREAGNGFGLNVGANGLAAEREATDDYADPNGTYSDSPLTDFSDDDNDATTGGDVNYRDPFSDIDRDAKSNTVDLDNDNDGILDKDECAGSQAELVLTLTDHNGSVSTTTANGGGSVEATSANAQGGTAPDGANPNSIKIAYRAKVNNPDNSAVTACRMTFKIGEFDDGIRLDVGTKTVLSFNQLHWNLVCEFARGGLFDSDPTTSSGKTGWTPWKNEGNPELIVTSESIQLMVDTNIPGDRRDIIPYLDKSLGTGSNAFVYQTTDFDCADSNGTGFDLYSANHLTAMRLTNVVATAQVYACNDTDGDGVANMYDLDSDNDGIYDAVESGSGVAHTDGLPTGPINALGIPLSVDANEDGVIDYTLANSDSDAANAYDFLVLDADGDGCNDVVEAGLDDSDDDGIIGTGTPTVDAQGRTTGSGGYVTPADQDGNSTFDFQQIGVAPSGAMPTSEQTAYVGTTVDLSPTTVQTYYAYQWQISTDGVNYTNLSESNPYSGTQISTLRITGIARTMDENRYRVIVTDQSFVCTSTFSDPVTLQVPADEDQDDDGILNEDECANANAILTLNATNFDGTNPTPTTTNGGGTMSGTITALGGSAGSGGTPVSFAAQASVPSGGTTSDCKFTFDIEHFNDGLEVKVDGVIVLRFGLNHFEYVSEFNKSGIFNSDNTNDFPTWHVGWHPWSGEGDAKLIVTEKSIQLFIDTNVPGERRDIIPYLDQTQGSGVTSFVYQPVGFDCETGVGIDIIPRDFKYTTYYTEIGGVTATASIYACGDTDGDGVVDMLDLDSDNDGIYDVVESGSGVAHTDGIVDGSVTLRGIPQAVDSDDNGVVDYTLANSDATGASDFHVPDADGDGCDDVIEAGLNDSDNDGIIGSGAPTVDAQGRTTGSGGYATPADNDENGTYDFQEAGVAPSGAIPFSTIQLCPGAEGTKLFPTTALPRYAYRWEVGTESGTYAPVVNDITYAGAQTDTLRIREASATLDGLRYRVVITDPSFTCSSTTTNGITLRIYDSPNAGEDGTLEVCDISQPVSLFGGITGPHNTTGQWLSQSPDVDISNPEQVRFDEKGFGPFIFTYIVEATATCPADSSTVQVTLDPACFRVVANPDRLTVDEDSVLAANVLTNDRDNNGGGLQALLLDQPTQGTATLSPDGQLLYTPRENYNGQDTLIYRVCDQTALTVCDTARVVITVLPVNDAPVAVNDAVITTYDEVSVGNVLTNDYDPDGGPLGEVASVGSPAHGTVTLAADGTYTYTPDRYYIGPDQFSYWVCDVQDPNLCAKAEVIIQVRAGLIEIPKGFSPNNDNNNDRWEIKGISAYPNNSITIFNRWGNAVYRAQGYDNGQNVWDGTANQGLIVGGGQLPEGTYFYLVDLGPEEGPQSGYVVLMR